MEKLRKVTEEVFFINGVERSSVTSLFTPNVRYNEVVEDGFRGGNIVGADFDGSPEQLRQGPREPAQVGLGRPHRRQRPDRRDGGRDAAGERPARPASGSTCRRSRSSSRRSAPSTRTRARASTSSASPRRWATSPRARPACCVFFGVAFVITAVLLYWYSGSLVLTVLALICAIVPVIWLLGLLPVFGLGPRPDVDPGAVPDLLDRRVARGADDERLEARDAARRGRHHRSHALVPEAVHPGRDGAARQRARLHGDRVRRHRDRARARAHRDDRRDGDDHHQQDAAADPAVVLQVHARAGIEARGQGDGRRLALGAHRRARDAEGRLGIGAGRARAAGVRHLAGAPPAHRRPRQGRARSCAPTRATTRTST